jgi:hypothetical protein
MVGGSNPVLQGLAGRPSPRMVEAAGEGTDPGIALTRACAAPRRPEQQSRGSCRTLSLTRKHSRDLLRLSRALASRSLPSAPTHATHASPLLSYAVSSSRPTSGQFLRHTVPPSGLKIEL